MEAKQLFFCKLIFRHHGWAGSILATTPGLVCKGFYAIYDDIEIATGQPKPNFEDIAKLSQFADELVSGLPAAAKDLGVNWPID